MGIVRKSFVCPYCFEEDDLYRIKFRCQNDPMKCEPVADEVYGKFRNTGSQMMPRVFEIPDFKGDWDSVKGYVKFKLPKKLPCPNCNENSQLRICPYCHSELPYTIGDYKDLTIAIIGAKEAGKSHYISVLIRQIQQQIGRSFNANLQPINDETINRYREDFYRPVYQKREVISATRSARTQFDTRVPLVYTFSFMKKNLFGRTRISNVSTLTFFDTAGEDLDSEELMRTENKYIYNSQGIILLIDPLQIPEVRHVLESRGVSLPQINTESEDIISRVAKLIRTAKGIGQKKKIDIPLAIAFSKIDALKDELDASSPLHYDSSHDGYFNLTDFEALNTEMMELLREWEGEGIIRQVEHNFSRFAFFGLSALGANPHGEEKIAKVRPLRVEDPFLWLLYNHKILKGKE